MSTQTPCHVLRFQDCGNENWEFYHDHDKRLRFSITAFSDQIRFRDFRPGDDIGVYTFIKMKNGSPTGYGSHGITDSDPLLVHNESVLSNTWSIELHRSIWDIVTETPGEGAVQDVTIWVRDIKPTAYASATNEPAKKLAGKFTGDRLEIFSGGYVTCTMFATLAFLTHPLYSSHHVLRRTTMLSQTPRLVLKFQDRGGENWEFRHEHDEHLRFSITTFCDQLRFQDFQPNDPKGVYTFIKMKNGSPTGFGSHGIKVSVPLEVRKSDESNTWSIELNGCKWDIVTVTPREGAVQDITIWVRDIKPTAYASATNEPAKKLAGKFTGDRLEIFSGDYVTCTMFATLAFLTHPLHPSHHRLKRTAMLNQTPRLVLKFQDCGNENWEFRHDHDKRLFRITTVGDKIMFQHFEPDFDVGVYTFIQIKKGFPTGCGFHGNTTSYPLKVHKPDESALGNTWSIELNRRIWDIVTVKSEEGVARDVTIWVRDTANESVANNPAKKLAGKFTGDRLEILLTESKVICTMFATIVFLGKIYIPDDITEVCEDSVVVNNPVCG